MAVICKVCDQEFKKLITNTHLKKHGMTTTEYANVYGKDSLSCEEYRRGKSEGMKGEKNPNYGNSWSESQKKSASENMAGTTPWNKGKKITDETALRNIREGAKTREGKYASGELERSSYERTDEIKCKISEGVKAYAKENGDEISERATRALATKVKNGHELAFFRGKKHTVETKEVISAKSKERWVGRSKELMEKRLSRLESNGYSVCSIDDTRMHLKCIECGTDFNYHIQYSDECRVDKGLCPSCNPRYVMENTAQWRLYEYIKSVCPDAIPSYREFDGMREIDVYVPSKNIGFEYNGLYWHSQTVLESNGKSKTKDYDKFLSAKKNGIRMYTVFEDEYVDKEDITLSRISNILGTSEKRIYARKCTVVELTSSQSADFMKKNHIMGNARSNVRLGLMFDGELVSVMTFSKNNLSRKVDGWEINRFASIMGSVVVGGASKMFKHFIRNENPETIVSYADTRWSDGKLYETLGFTKVADTPPNYWYFYGSRPERLHRFTMRKNESDNSELTEYENRLLQGYDRVYDCGSTKWEWTSL